MLVLTSLLIAKTCRTQGTKKRTSQACTNTSPGPMLHGNTTWCRHPHATYSLLKVYSGHTVQRLKRQNLGLPPQTKYSSNSTHTETRCTAFQKKCTLTTRVGVTGSQLHSQGTSSAATCGKQGPWEEPEGREVPVTKWDKLKSLCMHIWYLLSLRNPVTAIEIFVFHFMLPKA